MAVAADVFRDIGDLHRQIVGFRVKPVDQFADGRFVIGDQPALGLALRRPAERVERPAAQALEFRQHGEGGEDPRAVFAFLEMSGLGIAPGQQRRREMDRHAVVAVLEGLGGPAAEIAVRIEPGDLILVLVSHQLVEVPRHGERQARPALCLVPLRRFGRPHQAFVPVGPGGVLVGGQVLAPDRDDLIHRLGPFRFEFERRGRERDLAHGFEVNRGAAAPVERPLVGRHGDAVQFDRLDDRGFLQRHHALLQGIAEHEHVGRNRIAHQAGGDGGRFERLEPSFAHRLPDDVQQGRARELQILVPDKAGGHRLLGVDDGAGLVPAHLGERSVARRHHQVAADHRIRLAGRDPDRVDVLRPLGDADMAHHRAVLLRDAGMVEGRDALALDMGGHGDQGADGDDAGAADAGHQDAVGLATVRNGRIGDRLVRQVRRAHGRRRPPRRGAVHGHEARAEALDAGEILVAVRLVDLALAAELGLDRRDRHAVRLDRAVAAAFAHPLVDEDALRRIVEFATLAAAAFLGGAGLVVDQHRHALPLAQVALDPVEIVAVVEGDARREMHRGRILVRLVGDDNDLLRALGIDLERDVGHRRLAFHGLSAGHRHGVVVENLVGDVDAGRDAGPDRQQAAVIVGAVAQVGEDVLRIRERRLADPWRAFAAHLGEGRRVAVHPLRHEMAADAGYRAAALRHPGRAVVRAAGAEIGRPVEAHRFGGQRLFLAVEEFETAADALVVVELENPLADRP